MGGEDRTSGALFSYVDVEARIPAKHPLRAMRRLTNAALAELDRRFSALTRRSGVRRSRRSACCRPRCCSFSIRSARSGSVERLEFDLLFRWSSGLPSTRRFSTLRPSPRTATVCSRTRSRKGVDGRSFGQGWLGRAAFAGRNGEADFRKTKRSNETHASTTDKDARLFRKGGGQESRLCYLGHALIESRNGLVAAAEATLATGTANARRRSA